MLCIVRHILPPRFDLAFPPRPRGPPGLSHPDELAEFVLHLHHAVRLRVGHFDLPGHYSSFFSCSMSSGSQMAKFRRNSPNSPLRRISALNRGLSESARQLGVRSRYINSNGRPSTVSRIDCSLRNNPSNATASHTL